MSASGITRSQLESLVELADSLLEEGCVQEAAGLLEIVTRLEPSDARAAESLADARTSLQNDDSLLPGNEHDFKRSVIDASHFTGLAQLYLDRGETSAALECIQMAKEKAGVLPTPHKLHGLVLKREKDYHGAEKELQAALRFNPFDREVAEELGLVYYELKKFEASLAATVDSFLLLRDNDTQASIRLQRRIRTLKRVLNWENQWLIRMFHDRRASLSTSFDRLQWRRDLFLEEKGLIEKGLFPRSRVFHEGGASIALASKLRRIQLWAHLTDEAIFNLTRVVREEEVEEGTTILAHGDAGRDLFFLTRGEVSIQRQTPYGHYTLRRLEPGALLGEINFVSAAERTSEAIATARSQLIRVDAEQLDQLIEDNPDTGVEVYSSLWHALAEKLRSSNELLRTFFPGETTETLPEALPSVATTDAGAVVEVDTRDKIRLFHEQGLSRKELLTLATFSSELHYPAGSYLFREGEPGEEMFVVLEGQVRISKFIPGGGEEALSILRRGDFFGEISLIDGQPRSADAKAHRGPVTVLALDQATVREVLAMDPRASLEFLRLLCRLLATRMRELDEKLVMWRILSSHEDRLGSGTTS